MRIAVASGKGGTGKTTIATGLALSAAAVGKSVAYVDCDVEEPNGHIYLKPRIDRTTEVATRVPVIDETSCTLCRRCVEACRFGALAVARDRVLSFPELCHACGACGLVCPVGAISEGRREVGIVRSGTAGPVRHIDGLLTVGEAMPMPVLREVVKLAPDASLQVLDAPPGTSCPVVETLVSAEAVLLVVEPTPFGLHDFSLATELVSDLGRPAFVVVNKDDGSGRGHAAAAKAGLAVLASFPEKRHIAELCSGGEHPVLTVPDYAATMDELRAALTGVGESGGRS